MENPTVGRGGGCSPGSKVERPCVGRSGSGIRIQNVTVRRATLRQNRSPHCGEWETLNQGAGFSCGEEDPRSRRLGRGGRHHSEERPRVRGGSCSVGEGRESQLGAKDEFLCGKRDPGVRVEEGSSCEEGHSEVRGGRWQPFGRVGGVDTGRKGRHLGSGSRSFRGVWRMLRMGRSPPA